MLRSDYLPVCKAAHKPVAGKQAVAVGIGHVGEVVLSTRTLMIAVPPSLTSAWMSASVSNAVGQLKNSMLWLERKAQ